MPTNLAALEQRLEAERPGTPPPPTPGPATRPQRPGGRVLLRRVWDWAPCFRLLFPHPTPTVSAGLDERVGRLERCLVREREHSVPSTVDKAMEMIDADVADRRAWQRCCRTTADRDGPRLPEPPNGAR
jgi:hypothetical protein